MFAIDISTLETEITIQVEWTRVLAIRINCVCVHFPNASWY